MIRSFADKETEKVFNQDFSKKLPQSIQGVALRKLIMINDQYRICFKFDQNDCFDVEITDYH